MTRSLALLATLPTLIAATDCSARLATVQIGSDDQCSSGNLHHWPLYEDASDCHGWTLFDNDGKSHENSAAGMRCNDDGTFSFTQFAGNLVCDGDGVDTTRVRVNPGDGADKTITFECKPDIPTSLHFILYSACGSEKGQPASTQPDTDIYLNGDLCDESPPATEVSSTLTQTLCSDCSKSTLCDESENSIVYSIQNSSCYNPQALFPDDKGDVWGENDIMDECDDRRLVRTFYSSTDGSCTNSTDSYKLEYDTCLGPFGPTYPWGVFNCD